MTTGEKLTAAHATAAPAMGMLSLIIESKKYLTKTRLDEITSALRGAVAILELVGKD